MKNHDRTRLQTRSCTAICLCFALLSGLAMSASGQQPPSGLDRDRGRAMLSVIKEDLRKNYYDPNFRGMDIDGDFRRRPIW